MAYTTESMMAHAELHYVTANTSLRDWAEADGPQWAAATAQKAIAEALNGLLAVELAKYGLGE